MKKIKYLLPVLFTFCLIILFYFKRIIIIKYYPPIMNFFIFMVFFSSLFAKETVIQKFAKIIDGTLEKPALEYTKNLTFVWCIFLFVNFVIASITVFLSDEIWIIYNGFISYILIGILFAIEYIIRIIFKKRHGLQ